MPELLTIKQACEAFKIHRATLHRWVKQGMPTEPWGPNGRYRLDKDKASEWVRGRGEDGKAEGGGVLGKA